ncbi:transcriptional regulator, TetR family [Clostridium acidisoli DSM 12555]|uniref:Transcriptional regulator, TetR family n=1 Tax=Clostridium acidisoli DSM 12555 TaxID=1121291 RepID=A0A1W1XSM1_9CLOT|nr:TetR/AcrR family transcriptional regulator [Clostridium acidisoli]SMC26852.1 transcriptional regulator, TetR family [Clostridium acidisoli DSM 12555]
MKKSRRRGKDLEEAILNSTWKLLKENGYEKLTMDSIAENASTTKTVLYRRWNGKAEIIMAAARHHLPNFKITAPNTGNLRKDLFELFLPLVEMLDFLGTDTLQGILRDQLHKVSFIDILNTINTENALNSMLEQLFTYAHERKEINKAKLTNMAKTLPTNLIVNAILIGNLNKETIIHIIDDILLPTYQHTLDI